MKRKNNAYVLQCTYSSGVWWTGVFALIILWSALLVSSSRAAGTDNKTLSNAASGSNVVIKIGKHKDYVRIVLEAQAGYVDKASVMVAGSTDIKVVFQSPVAFTLGGAKEAMPAGKSYVTPTGLRIAVKESSAVITVNNLDDINVNKLQNPSRLVIDAFVTDNPIAAIPEEKPKEAGPAEEFNALPGTIVIDAGHGGSDVGIKAGSVQEKDFVLSFAKELALGMGKRGGKVFLTRKSDQALSISRRIAVAGKMKPSLLISLHLSSGGGLAVYTAPLPAQGQSPDRRIEKAAELAEKIRQKVSGQSNLEVRSLRLPLPVLIKTDTTALLLELPSPDKFKYDRNTKKALLDALSEILLYSREAAPAEKTPDPVGGLNAK